MSTSKVSRWPRTRSVVKNLLSTSAPISILQSPIFVTSLEEPQDMESVPDCGPKLDPLETSIFLEQVTSSNTAKATIIQKLKAKIKEYNILDRYLKQENQILKEKFHKVDEKVRKLKKDKKLLLKKARKWYKEPQSLYRRNKVLKIKLLQGKHKQKHTSFCISHLDLLA